MVNTSCHLKWVYCKWPIDAGSMEGGNGLQTKTVSQTHQLLKGIE